MDYQDGIFAVHFVPHARLTVDLLKQVHARRLEADARPHLLMVCGEGSPSTSREVEDYMSSQEVVSLTRALALVTRSFLAVHLAKMLLWYRPPPYPTRLFDDEAEARAWLVSVRDAESP